MKQFIVTCSEDRRFRVEYSVRAKNASDARTEFDAGRIDGENAEMDALVDQTILSVKEDA